MNDTNTNTTTTPTLNVSGVGAKPIKASGNLAVAVGTLQSGSVLGFAYNSSADTFELLALGAIHTATAFRAADGSVSAPGLAFAGETNTGLYRIGPANFAFALTGSKVADSADSSPTGPQPSSPMPRSA